MTAILSTTELRNMQEKDLQGEIMSQKALVAKLKMGIQLQKEKDSAKYQREKKTLARMETVLSEKTGRTRKTQKTGKNDMKQSPNKSSASSQASPSSLSSSPKKAKVPTPKS